MSLITELVCVDIGPGYRDRVVTLRRLIPPVVVSGSLGRRQVRQDVASSSFSSSTWSSRPSIAAGASVVVGCTIGTAEEVGEDPPKWLLENGQTGTYNTKIGFHRRPNATIDKIECLVRYVLE